MRLLGTADVATVEVAAGYVVVLAYLDVAPIRVLLRDYPTLARRPAALGRLLAALALFWLGQSALMLLVSVLFQATVLATLDLPHVRFVFFAMALDFIALSLRGSSNAKTIFFAVLSGRVSQPALPRSRTCSGSYTFILLVAWPSLETYGWLLIVGALGSAALLDRRSVHLLRSAAFGRALDDLPPAKELDRLRALGPSKQDGH